MVTTTGSRVLREVVLVGAGHAHVQVLRAFAMERPADVRLTLVVDTPVAVYSGMVPGVVAGQYRPDEVEIDAVPLARRAGARVVLARATGVDVGGKRILLADRPSLPYDLASVDIGSTVTGGDLPGVREHVLATRPIGRFLASLTRLEALARAADGTLRVVVVGGGAAGCELVCTLQTRLTACLPPAARLDMSLLHAGPHPLPGYPDAVVARVEKTLDARGIRRVAARTVTGASAGGVHLGDDVVPADVVVWATGAAAHPFFAGSGLPTDERGFVLTRPTLQVVGDDALFAVGDCATLADFPATPKAGVYAVRQGPVLLHNLRAALNGAALARYRPQRDFLALLNLGDGTAIGAKWGRVVAGRWVMRWKDRIDRRFMRRFQVLAPAGGAGPGLPAMAAGDSGTEMVCGGCAAKLGQESLERALGRLPAALPAPEVELGAADADDVVAWRLPAGDLLVASVDSFRAFTDDPWLVGRVAALNAVSDLEAKGVAARWAQAIVALPLADDDRAAEETLFQVLAGARSVFDPLAVRLLGGHTSRAVELQVGFVVQGVASDGGGLLRRRGRELAAGQRLILTKALGTGVIWHADMAGRARGRWLAAALTSMQLANAAAAAIGRGHGATAATDITGFGLAGHLASMLAGSGLAATVELATLPALPGALDLLAAGERSTFHEENARLRRAMAIPTAFARDPRLELLFDPQTAGGLLLVVPAAASATALAALRAADVAAVAIGELAGPRQDGAVIAVT